jgi:hypothetical protein
MHGARKRKEKPTDRSIYKLASAMTTDRPSEMKRPIMAHYPRHAERS